MDFFIHAYSHIMMNLFSFMWTKTCYSLFIIITKELDYIFWSTCDLAAYHNS